MFLFAVSSTLGYSLTKDKPPPHTDTVNVITPQILTCKKLVNSLLESQRQYAGSVELLIKALNQQGKTQKFDPDLLKKVNENVNDINGRLKFTEPQIEDCLNA